MDSSKVKTLDALYINSCGVQTCKKLNENIDERCCGCKITWDNQDCLMLKQDKKVDLYFDEALRSMNLSEVEKDVKDCVSALLPRREDQVKFWQRLSMDPRQDQAWKARIKADVMNIVAFSW